MKAWEDKIRKVTPYVPGEQPDKKNMIKINTNENPYPPSPKVMKAVREFPGDQMRFYPDPASTRLVSQLAEYHRVKPEQVFVGVGSDDVLAMCFMTFFHSNKPILFPDITYSFYPVWAELFRIPFEKQKLDTNFYLNWEDYQKDNGGIIFPNPNAPTGICEKLDTVRRIAAANPDVIIIVDEAYIDFGGTSALELMDEFDHLMVVRTFSKSRSMAGMRIGYAIGNETLIRYLNDVKYSFNSYTMNQLSFVYGGESLKDETYFQETIRKVVATREWTSRELKDLGFVLTDSKANFLFAAHPQYRAEQLFEALKDADIYVRYFKIPRIDNHLRISIGTEEEMKQFISFLKKYMNKKG